MTRTLRAVTRAVARRNKADADVTAAIRAAHEAGDSLRQIGRAAGLSHVRVLQILRGE